MSRGTPSMRAGQRRRVEPRGVDQIAAADDVRLVAAGRQLEAVAARPPGEDRGAQHDRSTGGLGLALIGEHQRVAVDDPGRRRQQRRDAIEVGFEAPRLRRVEPFEVVDAVGARRGGDPVERREAPPRRMATMILPSWACATPCSRQ